MINEGKVLSALKSVNRGTRFGLSLYYRILFSFIYLFIYLFFGCLHGMYKFLGQRLNPHYRSNPSHCSDSAGSLTHWVTRQLLEFFIFYFFLQIYDFLKARFFHNFPYGLSVSTVQTRGSRLLWKEGLKERRKERKKNLDSSWEYEDVGGEYFTGDRELSSLVTPQPQRCNTFCVEVTIPVIPGICSLMKTYPFIH